MFESDSGTMGALEGITSGKEKQSSVKRAESVTSIRGVRGNGGVFKRRGGGKFVGTMESWPTRSPFREPDGICCIFK